MASYKALTRRWKKNPRLLTWFSEKTDEDKVVWYGKHKKLRAGAKFSMKARVRSTHFNKVAAQRLKKIHWMPFCEFEELQHDGGCYDAAVISSRWKQKCMKLGAKTKRIDGELHVMRYKGVEENEINEQGSEMICEEEKECDNEVAFKDAVDAAQAKFTDGQKRIFEYFDFIHPAPPADCMPEDIPDRFCAGMVQDDFAFGNGGVHARAR